MGNTAGIVGAARVGANAARAPEPPAVWGERVSEG
jgi:hypothetical protein